MSLDQFIQQMPKVELHVHLEGAVQPATLLRLARAHGIALPATGEPELRDWYRFRDFGHFVEIYDTISACIRTPDDLELIAREFLLGQAAHNILYSEVIYTPYTHYRKKGLAFADQLAAINRARRWAEATLGVTMRLILDFARKASVAEAQTVAEWAIGAMADGVVGIGVGGMEAGQPAAKFRAVFARAREAGLARLPHAGETAGAASIWEAVHVLQATRIGHGVRCVEQARLVELLRERRIPLEVCPSSNVCLGVVGSLAEHPLPELIRAGLYVTINSDDPPLFHTTLTDEYRRVARAFGLNAADIERLAMDAAAATLLPPPERGRLSRSFAAAFERTRAELAP